MVTIILSNRGKNPSRHRHRRKVCTQNYGKGASSGLELCAELRRIEVERTHVGALCGAGSPVVVSGRPGLAELIDHARPGDRLCVTRLDRLGLSLRELLETVDALKARGIYLVSLEERLDTSSAAGELVFHVFGAIAHFEARLISERTRDGIAAARRRGRTPGRPPLDPETVSAAQKLIEAGLSPARAAKQLGIGRATAYRLAAAMREGASAPLT